MVKNVNVIQITDTIDLVKKIDHNTKIEKIEKKLPNHDKYITTVELNKLPKENFENFEGVIQENLASKNDIANFVKKTQIFIKTKKNYKQSNFR